MKDFTASLDILSEALTLQELSRLLGQAPDPGSHSRGDSRRANLGVFNETIWSLYSKAPASAPLEDHLRNIKERYPPERLRSLSRDETSGVKSVLIDVALFFEADRFSAHVILSREVLRAIEDYGADVQVICYPVAEDDQESGMPAS